MPTKTDIVLTTPYHELFEAAIPRTTVSTCVGLSYLKSYLSSAGFSSRVLDPYGQKKGLEETMSLMGEWDTGIYGISATYSTYPRLDVMAGELKRHNPSAKVIVGGWSSFSYDELLATIPAIDYVVVGPGEISAPLLVKAILEGNLTSIPRIPGVAFRNSDKSVQLSSKPQTITDLDSLLLPDVSDTPPWRLTSNGKLTFNYYSSRGCVNHCKFCTIGLMHESYRTMSGQKVVDDWSRYLEKYPGLETVNLADDLFDIKRLQDILTRMQQRGMKLKLLFQSSAQNVCANEDLLRDPAIQDRIERLDMGIETFSGSRLRFFAKPSTPEMNWQAIETVTNNGIDSLAYLILDGDLKELEGTKQRYVHPYLWPKNIWMNGLVVFPHSRLSEQWYKEQVLPWQIAFHRMMKPFHNVRLQLKTLTGLYEPGLKRFQGSSNPEEKRKWDVFNKKQIAISSVINGLVVQHFEEALDVARAVNSGRISLQDKELEERVAAQETKFQTEIDRTWDFTRPTK